MHDRDTMMDLSASNSAASSSAGVGATVDSTVVGEDPVVIGGGRRGRTKAKDKPKKKRFLSASSKSLSAIPNRIQLSMLNSGLIHISKSSTFSLHYCPVFAHIRTQIPAHSYIIFLFSYLPCYVLHASLHPFYYSCLPTRHPSLPNGIVGK